MSNENEMGLISKIVLQAVTEASNTGNIKIIYPVLSALAMTTDMLHKEGRISSEIYLEYVRVIEGTKERVGK